MLLCVMVSYKIVFFELFECLSCIFDDVVFIIVGMVLCV